MTTDQDHQVHPLDGCDPGKLDDIMRDERRALITAQRESQDNFVKTIVQLSSSLVVLMAGFSTQAALKPSNLSRDLFVAALVLAVSAIILGLIEQLLTSKACKAQQVWVELYYTKRISKFDEPKQNWWINIFQIAALLCFTTALGLLSIMASIQIGANSDVGATTATATTATTATTTATTAATTATAANRATATAAKSTATTAAAPGIRTHDRVTLHTVCVDGEHVGALLVSERIEEHRHRVVARCLVAFGSVGADEARVGVVRVDPDVDVAGIERDHHFGLLGRRRALDGPLLRKARDLRGVLPHGIVESAVEDRWRVGVRGGDAEPRGAH